MTKSETQKRIRSQHKFKNNYKLDKKEPKQFKTEDNAISNGNNQDINEDFNFKLFPRHSIYLLLILVICNRIYIALSEDNLWMIHPDEVYQSIEIAHSEVYGYGFRPYEYMSSPKSNALNLSLSESRHLSMGMYSMRSWLYPRLYQFIFLTKNQFNISLPPFYYAKTFHSVLASFLPLSVYRFSSIVYKSSDAAFISAAFVALSSTLTVLGTHTLIQSFNSPIIFTLMSLILKKSKNCYSYNPIMHFMCGTGFGLILIIRNDVTIFYFIIIITLYSYFEKSLYLLLGFIIGVFLGGLNDFINYGYMFISYRNWIMFQLNYADKLFGSQPFITYFYSIITTDHTTVILSILSLIYIFYQLITFVFPIFEQSVAKPRFISSFNRIWLAAFYLLLIYSLKGHKEIRFVHDALVLVKISLAGFAIIICRYVYPIISFSDHHNVKVKIFKLIVYGELLLYSLENRAAVPCLSKPHLITPWAYAGLTESGLVNRGLNFIRAQDDVTGVVIDYSIHMTGAYSILHHNIPIIGKTHYEFREWIPQMRLNISDSIQINTLDRVNNFISVYNVQLLLKYVINKREYNYFITTGGRKLPKKGFRQIFKSSDQVFVFKRSKVRADHEDLIKYGNRLPIGTNSTVLEYESSWLITLELYDKAVERLEFCIQLDAKRIRTWQLLKLAYAKLNQISSAEDAMKRCYSINGKAECQKQQDKVILHPEYQLNL